MITSPSRNKRVIQYVLQHNNGVQDCIDHFSEDFACHPDEFCALSYLVEEKRVVHTGTILPN